MTKQTDESIGIAFVNSDGDSCDIGGGGGGGGGDDDGGISIGGSSGGSSYSGGGGGGGGGGGYLTGSGALEYIYPVPGAAYLPGAAYSGWNHWYIDELRAEITRLRDENARLRAALKGDSNE
jgi:hypothetical protein